jgi:hypothetical protein
LIAALAACACEVQQMSTSDPPATIDIPIIQITRITNTNNPVVVMMETESKGWHYIQSSGGKVSRLEVSGVDSLGNPVKADLPGGRYWFAPGGWPVAPRTSYSTIRFQTGDAMQTAFDRIVGTASFTAYACCLNPLTNGVHVITSDVYEYEKPLVSVEPLPVEPIPVTSADSRGAAPESRPESR